MRTEKSEISHKDEDPRVSKHPSFPHLSHDFVMRQMSILVGNKTYCNRDTLVVKRDGSLYTIKLPFHVLICVQYVDCSHFECVGIVRTVEGKKV
jgi:hypothetical protein